METEVERGRGRERPKQRRIDTIRKDLRDKVLEGNDFKSKVKECQTHTEVEGCVFEKVEERELKKN